MKNITLVVLRTHIINEQIINEYKKIKQSGYNVLLLCDNRDSIFPDTGQSRGCLRWRSVDISYLLTMPFDYYILNLPRYTYNHEEGDFPSLIWYNGDYPFYLVHNIYPEYNFYWMFDYDCYLNARDYTHFFAKYSDDFNDLLIPNLQKILANHNWIWSKGVDWAYKDNEMWASFFPVVRLSASAIKYLYTMRLAKAKLFEQIYQNRRNVKWLFSEIFTPTELANANFNISKLDMPHVVCTTKLTTKNFIDKFSIYDDQMYHPVKSGEIYSTLFSKIYSDKNILEKLTQELIAINPNIPPALTNIKHRYVQFPVLGINDVHFEYLLNDAFIDIALHFENKYEHLYHALHDEIKTNNSLGDSLIAFNGTYKGYGFRFCNYKIFYTDELRKMALSMHNLMTILLPIVKKYLNKI